MQEILTQLIKEKELPRALQWCNVSTEQGTYLGENLRKPPCAEKGIIKTALLHSLAGHQQGDIEEAASGVLIISSLVQLLGCSMC